MAASEARAGGGLERFETFIREIEAGLRARLSAYNPFVTLAPAINGLDDPHSREVWKRRAEIADYLEKATRAYEDTIITAIRKNEIPESDARAAHDLLKGMAKHEVDVARWEARSGGFVFSQSSAYPVTLRAPIDYHFYFKPEYAQIEDRLRAIPVLLETVYASNPKPIFPSEEDVDRFVSKTVAERDLDSFVTGARVRALADFTPRLSGAQCASLGAVLASEAGKNYASVQAIRKLLIYGGKMSSRELSVLLSHLPGMDNAGAELVMHKIIGNADALTLDMNFSPLLTSIEKLKDSANSDTRTIAYRAEEELRKIPGYPPQPKLGFDPAEFASLTNPEGACLGLFAKAP